MLALCAAALLVAVLMCSAWIQAQAQVEPISAVGARPIDSEIVNPMTGDLPTLATLFGYAPVINTIIAGLSAIALLLFVYFSTTITVRAMVPTGFVDDVTRLVTEQRYKDAADLCRHHRNIFVASIVQRCIENASKDHSLIMDILDTEGRRRADILWNRISYLADVSNVAPMLGLLGTVLGMIKAFFTLPSGPDSINSRILSAGIGQAMATTMFGLIVAIVSLVFYSLVKGRATGTLAEAERVTHKIADHMKDAQVAMGAGGQGTEG